MGGFRRGTSAVRKNRQSQKTLHMKDFQEMSRGRFSCRNFSPKEVPEELIATIVETARLCPTAANRQPYHVWVIKSQELLEKVKSTTRSNYGAPLIFAVGVDPAKAWTRRYDAKNGADIDGGIVATHIMLSATDLGLGSLWVGSFDPVALSKLLPGAEGYEMIAMICVGYPQENCSPSPMHSDRKPVGELFTEV